MLYPMTDGSQWGLIDRQGTWRVPPSFDAVCFPAGEAIMVKKNGLVGFLDSHGQRLTELCYMDSLGFWEGKASVGVLRGDQKSLIWGVIGSDGRFAIDAQFDFVGPFFEGRARASQGGLWGYIDGHGRWLQEPRHAWCGDFVDGIARVQTIAPQLVTSYIDRQFQPAFEATFDNGEDFSAGHVAVLRGGRWGLADRRGQLCLPFAYEELGELREGWIPALVDGRWVFLDQAGRRMDEQSYDSAESFQDGLARVRSGDWRFIDGSGSTKLRVDCDHIEDFVGELALFRRGDSIGYMERDGRILIAFTP